MPHCAHYLLEDNQVISLKKKEKIAYLFTLAHQNLYYFVFNENGDNLEN